MSRFLFIGMALGIFLIGCSSAGEGAAGAGPSTPLPTAVPTEAPAATPYPTVTPSPTNLPAPKVIPQVQLSENDFADVAGYRQWLNDLPDTIVCTDELDSVRLTCFSKTDDLYAVGERLLQGFPSESFVVFVFLPMDEMREYWIGSCSPPNRHYPGGSCTFGNPYRDGGDVKVRPSVEE